MQFQDFLSIMAEPTAAGQPQQQSQQQQQMQMQMQAAAGPTSGGLSGILTGSAGQQQQGQQAQAMAVRLSLHLHNAAASLSCFHLSPCRTFEVVLVVPGSSGCCCRV
jgi:hypothetical protein